MSAGDVQSEMVSAESDIPLPAGYIYPEFVVPSDAVFEEGYGRIQVETYAGCAWIQHWVDSFIAQDNGGQEEALGELTNLRQGQKYLLADSSYQRAFDRLLDSLEIGSPDAARRELEINCPELVTQ